MTTQAAIAPTSTSTAQIAVAGSATVPESASVSTPAGTLAITLTPPPTAPVPLIENVVFWVSIISFIGVAASLWQAHRRMTKELNASDARLKKELTASADEAATERNQSREQANLDRKHAAGQAHQERITEARREVYLELIGEMTKAQFAISLLPTQDIEKLEVQALFGGLITATAKISILGEMPSVKKSRELLSATNKILTRALVLLVPINEHKDEENELREKIASHRTHVARVRQEMQPFLDKRTTASSRFAELQQKLQWHLDEINKLETAKLGAVLSQNAARKVFDDAILEETTALSGTVDELILAIRTELGLATSINELNASSAAMQASARSAIAGLRSDLKEAYAD